MRVFPWENGKLLRPNTVRHGFRSTIMTGVVLSCSVLLGGSAPLVQTRLAHKLDLGNHGFAGKLAFAPDGQTLAVGCANLDRGPGDVLLFSTKIGSRLAALRA